MRRRKPLKIDDPRMERLPVWAKELIGDLQRERDVAVRQLKEFTDSQTPTNIWHEEFVCDGEKKGPSTYRHYIDAYSITAEFEGVQVNLLLRRDDGITITYGPEGRIHHAGVYCTPYSHRQFRVHKEAR